jgi:hypothetical protein
MPVAESIPISGAALQQKSVEVSFAELSKADLLGCYPFHELMELHSVEAVTLGRSRRLNRKEKLSCCIASCESL